MRLKFKFIFCNAFWVPVLTLSLPPRFVWHIESSYLGNKWRNIFFFWLSTPLGSTFSWESVCTLHYKLNKTLHTVHILHFLDRKMEAAITCCIFTCTYLCRFTQDQGSAWGQAQLLALKALPLVRLGIILDKLASPSNHHATRPWL